MESLLEEGDRCEEYDFDDALWSNIVLQKQFVDSELDPYKHLESGELARVMREQEWYMSDVQGS